MPEKSRGDFDARRNIVLSIGGIKIVLSASGHPTVGAFNKGDLCLDYGTPKIWMNTVAGDPGTWKGTVLS